MKLRNKKTGEIIEDAQYRNYSTADGFGISTPTDEYFYKSLKEFCEDWEDCEPLLLDELDRKIIRLWAHNNRLKTVISYGHDTWIGLRGADSQGNTWRIELYSMFISQLENGKSYSIDDLCGAEEE